MRDIHSQAVEKTVSSSSSFTDLIKVLSNALDILRYPLDVIEGDNGRKSVRGIGCGLLCRKRKYPVKRNPLHNSSKSMLLSLPLIGIFLDDNGIIIQIV